MIKCGRQISGKTTNGLHSIFKPNKKKTKKRKQPQEKGATKKKKKQKKPWKFIPGHSVKMAKDDVDGTLNRDLLVDLSHELGDPRINVEYNDPNHTYKLCGGVKARSVTSIVSRVMGPYSLDDDVERTWNRLSAKRKKLTTKERIREELVERNNERRNTGTNVHECFEKWIHGEKVADELKDIAKEYEDVFVRIGEELQRQSITIIATETKVADEELGVAGRFDLLGFNYRTETYVMLDLKTKYSKKSGFWFVMSNGYMKGKGQWMMLPAPFDNVRLGDRTKFSLQMRLYSDLIDATYGITIDKCMAIVVDCRTKEVGFVPERKMDRVLNKIAPVLAKEWDEILQVSQLADFHSNLFDFEFEEKKDAS